MSRNIMYNNYLSLNILKLFNAVLRSKTQFRRVVKFAHNTINSYSTVNYYDIKDKRDATDSLGFEGNDLRRTWTNRDDSTYNPFIDINNTIKPPVVETFKVCKVTNERLKVNLSVNTLESYELVAAVTHNILGCPEDFTLNSLSNYLENVNLTKLENEIELNLMKKRLINNLQLQWEKLINLRKITLEHNVMLLLIFDHLSVLTHELRNLVQSQMLLNIHKFTPAQIIHTFQVFSRHKERYKSFLNLLCLIFYDHMIPNLRTTHPDLAQSYDHNAVKLCDVIKFLKVLGDFKFKKLTDVLYAQVFDHFDCLSVEDLVSVGELFFKHKRDPNFVELYTKIHSTVFNMKELDFANFELYALGGESSNVPENTVELGDVRVLRSIFGCRSEFLISSVHHRIEFKRLWKHNINTNNTPWKLTNSESSRSLEDTTINHVLPGKFVSYMKNFEQLYEKIENVVINKFKIREHKFDFVANLISLVSDYSRYSTSNAVKILPNLYSIIGNIRDNNIKLIDVRRIVPSTLRENSHVFFYKIDPQNYYYRVEPGHEGVRYYKPEITISSLFQGNSNLYSLLLNSIENIIAKVLVRDKRDLLDCVIMVRDVLHPFYCVNSCQMKPFLTIDLLHMCGKLCDRNVNLIEFGQECVVTVENVLKNGLKTRLNRFTEFCMEFIKNQLGQHSSQIFSLKEKIDILKAVTTLQICNQEIHNLEFINSTVDQLLNLIKHTTEEDGIKVGVDLKLFDCLCDLIQFPVTDQVYQLLTQLLKLIHERIDYYSVPELVKLMDSLACSIKHFSGLDLEMNETYENLHQNLIILRENAVDKFNLKSNLEEDFNLETKKIINLLIV